METSDIFTLTILSLLVTSATILLALFMFRKGLVVPSGQKIEPAPPVPLATRLMIEVMFVVIVIIMAFGILISNPDFITDGGSSGGVPDLVYQIQIQDEQTGRPIKDAQILLEIEGRAEAKKITDSNGRSIMVVDPSLSGEHARLIVESHAYNISSQDVTLTEKGVPTLILLEPND